MRPPANFDDKWVEDENGCHIWQGAKNGSGYGYFAVKRRMKRAHRVAWERANGPIPPKMHIDHLCRVRACVNPDHLEVVTQAENNRRAATKTHCKRGHSDWLTRADGRGRECRVCKRLRGSTPTE